MWPYRSTTLDFEPLWFGKEARYLQTIDGSDHRYRSDPQGPTGSDLWIHVDLTIDIYYPDAVLPIHIAWHGEATAKSTTKYGRR